MTMTATVLREREHPQQPLPPPRPGERSRQRARTDQVQVGEAAPGHRGDPAGVGPDDLVHQQDESDVKIDESAVDKNGSSHHISRRR
jgi:hypothetical protein